jgi:hypothetical protein
MKCCGLLEIMYVSLHGLFHYIINILKSLVVAILGSVIFKLDIL